MATNETGEGQVDRRTALKGVAMAGAALAMPARVPSPRVPGWKPAFPNYRHSLDEIIEAWATALI